MKGAVQDQVSQQYTGQLEQAKDGSCDSRAQWSAAAQMAGESMPERTMKAVVHVSMHGSACSEQRVTEYTGIYLSPANCV